MTQNEFLRGQRINPKPVTGKETVADLVDNAFLAYNAGRLAEGCRLFAERMLDEDVTVGMSLTGAMTPAGLGMSTIIPLIEAGFVDWIVSTGANLYHDAHFGLGMAMHRGTPFADDVVLREEGVVRIYDIFFEYDVLLSTDRFVREVSAREEFQRPMNTAEQALSGSKLRFDVSADVNETSAIVFSAKVRGGKSGVLIIGGGSPKNFVLQTE